MVGHGQGSGLGNYIVGQRDGVASVELTWQEAAHGHIVEANNQLATTTNPENAFFAVPAVNPRSQNLYSSTAGGGALAPSAVTPVGGSVAHENQQPYVTVGVIIALQGIIPGP